MNVDVDDGAQYRTQAACSIGIFLASADVAGIVICPDQGLARCYP